MWYRKVFITKEMDLAVMLNCIQIQGETGIRKLSSLVRMRMGTGSCIATIN